MMKSLSLVTLLLALFSASRAAAAETEVREFAITVDNAPCGRYRMTIERRDDGTVSMAGQASVAVKKLGITVYRYTYSGTEVWQDRRDGRLLGLNSSSNDDGKKYDVYVSIDGENLRARVNGQTRQIRGDVWTMTFWRMPHARFHNQGVPLLDADTGKDYAGRVDHLGTAPVAVSGQNQNCHHFRVTGGPYPVDLWYDAQHRLVREEFTEDGHCTVLQLIEVRR
jgi:hypothetical protein